MAAPRAAPPARPTKPAPRTTAPPTRGSASAPPRARATRRDRRRGGAGRPPARAGGCHGRGAAGGEAPEGRRRGLADVRVEAQAPWERPDTAVAVDQHLVVAEDAAARG